MRITSRDMEVIMRSARRYHQGLGEVTWPHGAKIAIIHTVGLEWWGRVGSGGEPEAGWNPVISRVPGGAKSKLHLAEISAREYGASVGYQRIMNLLEKYGIEASWVTNANVVERYPEIVREIAERRHEFVGHQYDEDDFYPLMTREEEHRDIRKCIRLFDSVVGKWQRNGWVCSWWMPSTYTIPLLMEEDFVSHSDFHNAELPYPITIGGKRILEIPHSFEVNDAMLISEQRSPEQWLKNFKDAFDFMYQEGKEGRPRILNFAVHPFIIGRPHRMPAYEEMLRYSTSRNDVWFGTRIGIANWWNKHYVK